MPIIPPIETLVFDLGGVIAPHDDAALHDRLASRCDATFSERRLFEAIHDRRYGTGESPVTALHQRLVDEIGYCADWTQFVADWCCHLELDEAMLTFVEQLSRSHRVMLFSNTNREHWEYILALSDGRLGALEAYLSYQIGDLKPAVSAYALVADKAGIEPSRTLFFDDRADNVEGARAAGFQAEMFTSQSALATLLQTVGML